MQHPSLPYSATVRKRIGFLLCGAGCNSVLVCAACCLVSTTVACGQSEVEVLEARQTAEISPRLFAPPTGAEETAVITAFRARSGGWSVDEVLLDDERRAQFLDSCFEQMPERKSDPGSSDAFCRALLHVRKSGGRLPTSTKRASLGKQAEQLEPLAEIAARRLYDELGRHSDDLLVDAMARERFDAIVQSLAPEVSAYTFRKLALRLRKARRLEPELLSRVTDWRKVIEDYSIEQLRQNLDSLSNKPGIYLFYDGSGYLYIGQASDLNERLTKHLKESDRLSLADYLLKEDLATEVRVELHLFLAGSPGEDTRVRRAYESELIRTRSPRLNIAP